MAIETESPLELREIVSEALAAVRMLTLWPVFSGWIAPDVEGIRRSTVFLPLVGLALGILLGLIDHLLSGALSQLVRSVVVLGAGLLATGGLQLKGLADTAEALRVGSRPSPTGLTQFGLIGGLLAIAVFVLEVWCLGVISGPERSGALVMAMMLSRWTMVPTGYGLKPLERWGLGVDYCGGISFREFAFSSVFALGLTMGLYQIAGLAVIVVLALTILLMRLAFAKRLGGAAGYAIAGAGAIAELLVFATIALLVRA